MIDKTEYWKVSVEFIRYGGGRVTTTYMRRRHGLRRAKG